MSNETTVTVVGNLTADPELRFTTTGAAVASFTIASTPRHFDKDTGTWKDGEALFLRASIWRTYAEHVAETLTKGMQVIATGRLKQRTYEDREGIKRTVVELEVDEIGPTLRFATAKVTKDTGNRSGGGNASSGSGYGGGPVRSQGPATDDAWASIGNPATVPAPSATPTPAAAGWGAHRDDQPPF